MQDRFKKATGTVGRPIVEALLQTNQFNVTVLTRGSSTASQSSSWKGAKFATVDYESPGSLEQALRGQDAVVTALSAKNEAQSQALLTASVQAGVKRFLPSEFGSDTMNLAAAKLPVFASKKKLQSLVEALAVENKISYTYVISGPFFDFCLAHGIFGVDLKHKKFSPVDGGNSKFSTTTLASVGKAVAGILQHPDETKNRAVYFQDAVLTQRELLQLSQDAIGKDGWSESEGSTTVETEKKSYERLAAGERDMGVFIGFLMSAIFREGYGGHFQKLDNDLFGLGGLSDEQVVKIIKDVDTKLKA